MHNIIMDTNLLLQLLKELAQTRHTTKYGELSVDEQLLIYCYEKLDERDRKDLLCFLSEKISH